MKGDGLVQTEGTCMMELENVRLVQGLGDGRASVCLFSFRALKDGRGFTDAHPSHVLRTLGIKINDGRWWDDDAERTRVLMPIALDERLCASKCVVTEEAEAERQALCCEWLKAYLVPRLMERAAVKLEAAAEKFAARWPEHAEKMVAQAKVIREVKTREAALEGRSASAGSAAAAYAYAYAAAEAAADAEAAAGSAAAEAAADAAAEAAADAAAEAAADAEAAAGSAADTAAEAAADTAAEAAADAEAAAGSAAAAASAKEVRDELTGLFMRCLAVGQ